MMEKYVIITSLFVSVPGHECSSTVVVVHCRKFDFFTRNRAHKYYIISWNQYLYAVIFEFWFKQENNLPPVYCKIHVFFNGNLRTFTRDRSSSGQYRDGDDIWTRQRCHGRWSCQIMGYSQGDSSFRQKAICDLNTDEFFVRFRTWSRVGNRADFFSISRSRGDQGQNVRFTHAPPNKGELPSIFSRLTQARAERWRHSITDKMAPLIYSELISLPIPIW